MVTERTTLTELHDLRVFLARLRLRLDGEAD